MVPTTWRRALVAVVAASLVAVTVVLPAGDPNPQRSLRIGPDASSISPVPDATELKAAVLKGPTHATQRADGSMAKRHLILFIATLLAGLLMAAVSAWLWRRPPSVRPWRERRRHTLSLRGPPLYQLT